MQYGRAIPCRYPEVRRAAQLGVVEVGDVLRLNLYSTRENLSVTFGCSIYREGKQFAR